MTFEMEMIDETEVEEIVNSTYENQDITCETKMTVATKANQNTTYKNHEINGELEMTDNVETHNVHHL